MCIRDSLYAAIVVSNCFRIQLLEFITAVMLLQEFLSVCIGSPDGGQTSGLCGHNIHAIAVIGGHGGYTRSNELHYLVLNITILIYCCADCKRDIVWTNEQIRFAG